MGKAVAMATEAMNLTIDDVTILHYDANLPCGQVRYRTGALEYFLPTAPCLRACIPCRPSLDNGLTRFPQCAQRGSAVHHQRV